MKILKWILYAAASLVIFIGALVIIARFLDGPLAMIPGGLLEAGEMRPVPADWSFVSSVEEIELQTDGRSRTTWVVAVDGQAYIPASLLFPPWKTWHKKALNMPEAVVRIKGIRYAVNLKSISRSDPAYMKVRDRVTEKYGGLPGTPDPDKPPLVFKLVR